MQRLAMGGTALAFACVALLAAPATTYAQTRPYPTITGGDAAAGVSMQTPTQACTAAPHIANAGIVSWNNHGSPDFAGAGDEYAAFAMGQIRDFVTAQGTGQTPVANSLTFSNVDNGPSVDIPNGVFGGLFNDGPCVDLWGKKPADASLQPYATGTPLNGLNGSYRANGPVTIPASTIPTGAHITLYVTGNVSITGDIGYSNATWTSRTQIPSLRIIANGSIFVDAGVRNLEGLYAAIPDAGYDTRDNTFASPVKGTFITCAHGFTSFDPATWNDAATPTYKSACTQSLTINGGVIANQVWMLRLAGDLGTGIAAEVINYTPEMWLAIDPAQPVAVDMSYQSIVSLPPVL